MSEKRWLVGLVVAGKRETWGLGAEQADVVSQRGTICNMASARTTPGRIPDPMVESVPVGTVSTSTTRQGTKTWRNDKQPNGSISLTSRLNRVFTSESQSEPEMFDYRWLCKSAMAEGLLLVR